MFLLKKLFLIFASLSFFLLFFPSKADAQFPEKSPCFKDEVFINPSGTEPYDPSLGSVEPNSSLMQIVKCRRTTHYFVVAGCEKITSQINALREDPAGYCLPVDDYCLTTGCNPDEKKAQMSRFSFYTHSPYFHQERSLVSPIFKKVFGFFGEVELFLKPLTPIFQEVEKLTGINSLVLIRLGLFFLLNLFFISIVFLIFKRYALQEALWHEWRYLGKIFLVTLIIFIIDLKLKDFIQVNLITSYLVIFFISVLLTYLVVYRSLLRKFSITASVLFGVLSNPFWFWLLNFLIKKVLI